MFNFRNLTPQVRAYMASEINADHSENVAYKSPRLTSEGAAQFPRLLMEAAMHHDPEWLIQSLDGMIKATELRMGKPVKVPYTAAQTLAEGEFNKYYVRGVCNLALESGPDVTVEVYRAKEVEKARTGSIAKIGTRVSAAKLLADLRANTSHDLDSALGIPAGPNSGLSVSIA